VESEATRKADREAMFWNLMDQNAVLRERERWLVALVNEFREAVRTGPLAVQAAIQHANELLPPQS